MPKNTQLHFVRADNSDGENMDLLVIAASKAQALKFWELHFDDSAEPSDVQWIGVVPGVTPDAEAGPLNWSAINPD